MYNEPYLETCCRAALHRVMLAGTLGRPADAKDGPCLARLAGMGLVCDGADRRYQATEAGVDRHAKEVLGRDV